MAKYHISFNCIWSTEVEAENPEEAANIAECDIPKDVDIDGFAYVVNMETGETFEEI